jgi:uncharacterized protein (DUF2062 family)
MPRRFFRKFAIKRHLFHGKWYMAPFEHLLHDQNLWGIRRRSVVPAVAIGLFIGYMPFPGHPLMASLAALAFRVNIPIAALTTFVSNPLTMGPMYFLAHRLGRYLLGLEPQPFEFELSLDWVMESFANNWQPLMLGCFLLGTALALVGYVTLDLIWRASIADYKSRKRLIRRRRAHAERKRRDQESRP